MIYRALPLIAVLFLTLLALSATSFAGVPTTQTEPADEARQRFQARILQRAQQLNTLKQRYQFRLRDLGQDLREKSIKLAVDGMGTPGRLSTLEVELTNLIRRRSELETAMAATRSAIQEAQIASAFDRKIEDDARLNRYIQQIDEIDLTLAEQTSPEPEVKRLERRKAALEAKAAQRRKELETSLRKATVDRLTAQLDSQEQAIEKLDEQIKQSKFTLGDLIYQMTQYLTARDEEKATRELLGQVQRQLERLSTNWESWEQADWADLDRAVLGLPRSRESK